MDLTRYKKLAGLQKTIVNEYESKTKEELEALKASLENRLKIEKTFALTESRLDTQVALEKINSALEVVLARIDEHLKQVDGRWAIVSKSTGKPLRYYKGEGKPSDEWVAKQEKSIQYFKNMGESISDEMAEMNDDEFETIQIQETEKVPVEDYANAEEEIPQVEPLEANIANDEKTTIKLPKGLMASIDKRISELEKSMKEFDMEEFKIHYHNKQKAIDCLKFIKEKLNMGNLLGLKEAAIFYGTVASFISEMFPAQLILFLHTSIPQNNEVPTNSSSEGTEGKLKEKDIPYLAGYKPVDTVLYPQVAKSSDKPD